MHKYSRSNYEPREKRENAIDERLNVEHGSWQEGEVIKKITSRKSVEINYKRGGVVGFECGMAKQEEEKACENKWDRFRKVRQ